MPFALRWFSLCLTPSLPKRCCLIIYNESDYLEAHLTEISTKARDWSISIDTVPERLTSVLKKFTSGNSDAPPSKSNASKRRPR